MIDKNTNVEMAYEALVFPKPVLSDAVFRPMLFSASMVQAILEGRKTQTRRIVKLPNDYDGADIYQNGILGLKYSSNLFGEEHSTVQRLYPKMELGDIIWVRETFAETSDENGTPIYAYKAGGSPKYAFDIPSSIPYFADTEWSIDNFPSCGKWKPSLFMPKSACRLFLMVTDVRIERLNEISENDAIKEGIEFSSEFGYKLYSKNSFFSKHLSATDSYMSLWESINGKGSWKENPFVWVYTFKVVECPGGFR